jgi:hypothetical protein
MPTPAIRLKPRDIGRYMRCSTARSFRGMKLEVGANVIKNQMVPTTTQTFLHFRIASVLASIINPEKNIAGSVIGEPKGKPISTFRLKGK